MAAHEQDEAGASLARHREKVCALGLGKDMEIEELTKKVKALEALSAAEETRGIDLRERTRTCGQMILATGEVVALPRRAGEAVGLAERVSAWRAKLESGQMGPDSAAGDAARPLQAVPGRGRGDQRRRKRRYEDYGGRPVPSW